MPTIKELGDLTDDELGGRILNNPCNQQKLRQVVQEIAQAFTRIGDVDIPATTNASVALPTNPTLTIGTAGIAWQDAAIPFVDLTDLTRVYLPRTRSGDPNVQIGDSIAYALDSAGDAWATSDYMDDVIGTIKMWDGLTSVPAGWNRMIAGDGYIVEFAASTGINPATSTGLAGGGSFGGTIVGGDTGTGYADVTVEDSSTVTADLKAQAITIGLSGDLQTGYTVSGIGGTSVTDPTSLTASSESSNVSGGADGSIVATLDMANFAADPVADHTHAISWTSGNYFITGTGYLRPTETDPDGGHSHDLSLVDPSYPWSTTITYDVAIVDASHTHTISPDPHTHPLTEPNAGLGHSHTIATHDHPGSTTQHTHVFPAHSHTLVPNGHVHSLANTDITITMDNHTHTSGKPARYAIIAIIRIH